MKRLLFSLLSFLLATIGSCYGSCIKVSTPTYQMGEIDRKTSLLNRDFERLCDKIREAEEKREPQTALSACDRLAKLAEKERKFPYLFFSCIYRPQIEQELDPTEGRVSQVGSLLSLPWLSEVDRMLLHAYLMELYVDHALYSCYSGEEQRSQTDKILDVGQEPSFWTEEQYRSVIVNCVDAMFRYPDALVNKTVLDYQPLFELWDDCTSGGELVLPSRSLLWQVVESFRRVIDKRIFSEVETVRIGKEEVNLFAYLEKILDRLSSVSTEAELSALIEWMRLELSVSLNHSSELSFQSQLAELVHQNRELPIAVRMYQSLCERLDNGTIPAANRKPCRDRLIEVGKELLQTRKVETYERAKLLSVLQDFLKPMLEWRSPDKLSSQDTLRIALNKEDLGQTQRLHVVLEKIRASSYEQWQNLYPQEEVELVIAEYILFPEQMAKLSERVSEEERYVSLDLAFGLPYGVYRIRLKADPQSPISEVDLFESEEGVEHLFVTDLMDVYLPMDATPEVRVHNSIDGKAVAEAHYRVYEETYDREAGARRMKQLSEIKADGDGLLQLGPERLAHHKFFRPISGADLFAPPSHLYLNGGRSRADATSQTMLYLYTDRGVYRPKQSVHFAGFVYNVTRYSREARALAGLQLRAELYDVNGEAIDTLSLSSGPYGEFSGEFSLPTRTLSGVFHIRLSCDSVVKKCAFRVEEYKRPTFEINVQNYNGVANLGDTVRIEGTAKLYSGAGVSNAQIKARTDILRISRYWWRKYALDVPREVLSTSNVEVATDGSFVYELPLTLTDRLQRSREMLAEDERANSCYLYVTEFVAVAPNGETHTVEHSLWVGRPDLQLDLAVQEPYTTFGGSGACLFVDKGHRDTALHFHLSSPHVSTHEIARLSYSLQNDKGEVVYRGELLKSDYSIPVRDIWGQLPSAAYTLRAVATTVQGEQVELSRHVVLYSTKDKQLAETSELFVLQTKPHYSEKDLPELLVASRYDDVDVYCDFIVNSRIVHRQHITLKQRNLYRLRPNLPLGQLPPVCQMRIYMVRNGQLHGYNASFSLLEPFKDIRIKQRTFRDRTIAGSSQEWSFELTDARGKPIRAHVSAFMFDESLLSISPYHLSPCHQKISPYLTIWSPSTYPSEYRISRLSFEVQNFLEKYHEPCCYAPLWAKSTTSYGGGMHYSTSFLKSRVLNTAYGHAVSPTSPMAMEVMDQASEVVSEEGSFHDNESPLGNVEGENTRSGLSPIPRTDFSETAFFFPDLQSDARGIVRWSFVLPESLTRWQLRIIAHTVEMDYGHALFRTETYKELMLLPNMPRFLRRGDKSLVAATVYNHSPEAQPVELSLELFDPDTGKVFSRKRQKLDLSAEGNATASFEIETVDSLPLLGVRWMATGEKFSDGEQSLLPQLSDRETVRRTIPIVLSSNESKTIRLADYLPAEARGKARIELKMEGGLLWPVLRSLPTMIKPQSHNSVSLAASVYVNSVAQWLLSNPKLQTLWAQLREANPDSTSMLRKSGEAYDLLENEMPWLKEAKAEEATAAQLLQLLREEKPIITIAESLAELQKLQQSDGGFSWYSGMPSSYHITAYVVDLLTHLQLTTGIVPSSELYDAAFAFLDRRASEEVREMKERQSKGHVEMFLPQALTKYLYLSTLAKREARTPDIKEVWSYCLPILFRSMDKLPLEELPYAAIVADEHGQRQKALQTVEVLRQHLTDRPDQGAFFAMKSTDTYHWRDRRYPLHLAAMEAIGRVASDETTLQRMRLWLLSQRRVQYWPSVPETTDMIAALLLDESELLSSASKPRVLEVDPMQEEVRIEKVGAGMEWYGLYIEYDREIGEPDATDVVQQSPMKLDCRAYKAVLRGGRSDLVALVDGEELAVGDELRMVYSFNLDQAMDFVVLSDSRLAATEPIGDLSGYRYGAGTHYYFDLKDAAHYFFFDSLQRGQYRFAFSQRVQRAGYYRSGKVVLRSAYAPAFSVERAGLSVEVVDRQGL